MGISQSRVYFAVSTLDDKGSMSVPLFFLLFVDRRRRKDGGAYFEL